MPGLSLREIERATSQIMHHPPLGIIAVQSIPEQAVVGTAASVENCYQLKTEHHFYLSQNFGQNFKTFLTDQTLNKKRGRYYTN